MKLPLKSMPDFIALSHYPHANREGHKEAVILQFRKKLHAFFKNQTNPHPLWLSEFFLLAASCKEDKALGEVLNVYLQNIEATPVIEPMTLLGFADVLKLSSQAQWLTSSRVEQIFALLQTKSLLFKTDLSIEQSLQMVMSWQQLLLAMEVCGADIGPHKKAIKKVLASYKEQFEKANESVGFWQVRLAEQALCRLKDKTGHSEWFKAAVCVGAVGVHLCEAAAMGATGAATFGATALGAASPLWNAGKAAYEAGTHLIDGIKEAGEKRDWYPQVKELQAACFTSAFVKDNGESLNQLLAALKELNPEQLEPLIYALSETLIQISSSLPGEEYKATHQIIFDTLKDWFTTAKNPSVQSHVLDTFLTIGRRLQADNFIQYPIAVIEQRSDEYAKFPIAPSQVYNLNWFYSYCQQSEALRQQSKKIQHAIGERLIAQYIACPMAVLKVLTQLQANQSLDSVFIDGIKAVIKKQHLEIHKKSLGEAALKPKEGDKLVTASLVLTVWFGINESLQKELITLSSEAGLVEANQETPVIPSQQFLFGHVKHLVTLNRVDGGVQIHSNLNYSADELAKFIKAVNSDKTKEVAHKNVEESTQPNAQPGLAAMVDFSFIGNHLIGGIQLGLPKEAITAAQNIAKDILDRMAQTDSTTALENAPPALTSFANLVTQQKSPIHAGLAKQKQEEKEKAISVWYTLEKTADGWSLKIINRLLKQAKLSVLQPIFQGFFADNGDCDKDNTRRRKDNIFTEIGSYSKEALDELIESCNAALEKPLTVEEGAVAEGKTLPYPT